MKAITCKNCGKRVSKMPSTWTLDDCCFYCPDCWKVPCHSPCCRCLDTFGEFSCKINIYIYCIYNSIKNCRFLLCGRIYGESNETNRWRFILKAQKLIRAVLYQIIYYVCVWHARLSAMKGHDRVPAGDYILIIYILLWMLNMHDEVSKQAKSAASTVSVKCNCFQETEAPPKLLETAQTWKAQPSNYFLGC